MLVLTKISFREELQHWAIILWSFEIFPKILSLKWFSNSWGNSYIPCFLLIIMLSFICGERKIWSNIKKSQSITIDCLQNFLLLFMFQLTAATVANIHILAGIYFIFLKIVLDQTWKAFTVIPNLDISEKIGK